MGHSWTFLVSAFLFFTVVVSTPLETNPASHQLRSVSGRQDGDDGGDGGDGGPGGDGGDGEPTPEEEIIPCGTTKKSGGQGTTTFDVSLGQASGTFTVTYNMYSTPDQLDVTYEGSTLFTTGGLVSGTKTVTVAYSGMSDLVTITVSAPIQGTAWVVTVSCPTGDPEPGTPEPVLEARTDQ